MADIVERLQERAVGYDESGPSAAHTADMLREAAAEIERLQYSRDDFAMRTANGLAEIEQLRRERDELQQSRSLWLSEACKERKRAEAAEAEVAKLRKEIAVLRGETDK